MDRHESLRAFSQIHLGTQPERAVFGCFAKDPDAAWSAAHVATSACIEPREIEVALGRFLDAGIVERVAGKYRWRESLRYLFEGTEPDAAVQDPVCGMPVGLGTSLHAHDVFGRIEYFCSERCLTSFLVWPVAFTRPRAATHSAVVDGKRDGTAA